MTDQDILPPPRRPQLATNADFRKLLETPRAEREPSDHLSAKTKNKEVPKPKKKHIRPKAEPPKEEEEGPSYRDRAEERRKGINPDYERVTADLANLVGNSTDAELNSISVEDSKFLGGDVDHTHLVKGLDYALLQKVRGEMVKEEEVDKADIKLKKSAPETEVVKFKSPAGRGVFNAIFSRPKVKASELFLPGRTAFLFELDGPTSADVPTTLRRSKADCPEVTETMKGGMDTAVLERMVKIMSYMRGTSGKPGKMKKKEKLRMLQMMESVGNGPSQLKRRESGKPAAPADADADIFGDAGRDYVQELPKSHATNGRSAGGEMDLDAPPPPPPPPPGESVGPSRPSGTYDAAAAAYAAYDDVAPPPPPPIDDEDLELERLAGMAPPPPLPPPAESRSHGERKDRTSDADIIRKDTEDAYEECYPEYGGFTGAIVDSDEEDLSHMDTKGGKSRYDFNTEEQWEKYKSNKEMLPKAAFQFGVKMGDGRKGHKQLGKAVEQKEQKQLRQIQTMLNSKHGEQYSSAFKESRGRLEGESAPSKRRRI